MSLAYVKSVLRRNCYEQQRRSVGAKKMKEAVLEIVCTDVYCCLFSLPPPPRNGVWKLPRLSVDRWKEGLSQHCAMWCALKMLTLIFNLV